MKKIYITGHKNPDTDSIVSALAYTDFKKHTSQGNFIAVRAGKLNPQTEFILDKLNIKPPKFVNDLTPKVENYMQSNKIIIDENESLWEALEKLNKTNSRMIPIVDENDNYKSVLHYNIFAENIISKMAPNKSRIITTSVSHLEKVLKAQPIVVFNENDVFKAQIAVAGMNYETFKKEFDAEIPSKVICIVGNRENIQKYAIEKGVRVLIVTGGKMLTNQMKKLAKENKVTVLISPYETAKSSWLTLFASPVKFVADKSVEPLDEKDNIKRIVGKLKSSISRCLPVVDKNGKIKGILSENNLLNEPNIEVIMVDHNETSQAVEGIENYKIKEIIDHHRLGNIHTDNPIKFINKPVGSTSTLITEMYRENKVPLKQDIASLLLAGIISDTVILQSATTTMKDVEMAEYLSGITDLDIQKFGKEITNVTSKILEKPVDDIISMDMKEYNVEDINFSVSQIEIVSPDRILEKKDEFFSGLDRLRNLKSYYFSAIMVTDIINLNSILLIKGNDDFIAKIRYPEEDDYIYKLTGIISRKKQLIPYIMELIKKNNS